MPHSLRCLPLSHASMRLARTAPIFLHALGPTPDHVLHAAVSCRRARQVAMPQPPASPSLKFIAAVKSEAQWEEMVMQAPPSTLCICDVYAKWCGPCTALGKRITNMASDYME